MKIPQRVIVLIAAGLCLVLIGLAVEFLLVKRVDDATQPTDFSAVPISVHIKSPELTLYSLDGIQHTLSDYHGQIVLVNLWATWCPPCKAEMPILQTFDRLHKSEGFTVVAVEDGDPKSEVLSFVKQYNLTFPVWLDPNYQATETAFKTRNLPSSYVINRIGEVQMEWIGAISMENLEKYITPLLKEN